MTLELRPYQKDAIDAIEGCIIFGDTNIVLKAETSFGKSITAAGICERFSNKHIVILVNIEPLIDQIAFFLDELNIEYSILKATREKEFDTNARVQLVMSQTYYARADKLNIKADILIQDECFSPDTEVLTNKGFIRFDRLDKTELIAQYDANTGSISFVKPLEYIKRQHSGKLIHFKSAKNIDLLVTPDHEMLVSKNDNETKILAKDLKFTAYTKLLCGSSNTNGNNELTLNDKLAIAFQADGSMHCEYKNRYSIGKNSNKPLGECSILFSFSKQNKIETFLKDFKDLNIKEIKKSLNKNQNKKVQRRWIIKNVKLNTISKKLRDVFDIATFSTKKAIAFLDYLMIWDGYIQPTGGYYYSSTIKDNVDFIQEICIIAGKTSRIGIQKDNRKKSYSDVYRIYIKHTDKITTQSFQKKEIEYNGNVYCVTVPTHNIIVRRNNKPPIIVGNCHKEYNTDRTNKILNDLEPKVRIGLSATPWDQAGYKLADTEIIETASCEDLTQQGFLAPIHYYVPRWSEKVEYGRIAKSGSDYNLTSLDEIISSPKHISKLIDAMDKLNAKNKKILVFCSTIEQCDKIESALVKAGYSAAAYHSKKSKTDNERIMISFRTNIPYAGSDNDLASRNLFNDTKPIEENETIRCLISVSKLTTGFSVDDIDLGVVARPTKVKSLWHQIAGRVRRKADILDKWIHNLEQNNELNNKIAFIASVYNEVDKIKKQLKKKNIQNIDVFPYGSEPKNYDIIITNVRPNKEYGEILDLGQCITNHGFPEESYNPPEYTGFSLVDKKNMEEATEHLRLKHLSAVIKDDTPQIITREKYNLIIEEITKNATKLTNLTIRELSDKLEVSTDPLEIIAIVAVLFDKFHCTEPVIDDKGREVNGYISNKGKVVSGFLNPYSIGKIAEPWIEAFKYEDQYYQRKYIKSLKTRSKNLLKNKGSIWALKFFIAWLLEEDAPEKEQVDDQNEIQNNEPSYEIVIEDYEDEIPF